MLRAPPAQGRAEVPTSQKDEEREERRACARLAQDRELAVAKSLPELYESSARYWSAPSVCCPPIATGNIELNWRMRAAFQN